MPETFSITRVSLWLTFLKFLTNIFCKEEEILEANLSLMRSENSLYTFKYFVHIYLPDFTVLVDRLADR